MVLLGEDDDLLIRELKAEFPSADLKRESSSQSKAAVNSSQTGDPLLSKLAMNLPGPNFSGEGTEWNALI